MDRKRDRWVSVYLRRSTNDVVILPYICYLAGVSAAHGKACIIRSDSELNPLEVGRHIVTALKGLKGVSDAEIDALRRKWMDQLRSLESLPDTPHDPSWRLVLETFPTLRKGPGTYLRQFAVVNVIERDGWKSRKIVRVLKAKERNCLTDGESCRVALSASPRSLGQRVLECLAE